MCNAKKTCAGGETAIGWYISTTCHGTSTMRITCLLAVLSIAACYESAWIQRSNTSHCFELCTDVNHRNCLLSAEYNWTSRQFHVLLQMCVDSEHERNCLHSSDYGWIVDHLRPSEGNTSATTVACVRNEESLASQYDSFEVTMRIIYRQNVLTPMRIYRNTTPEYKALLESTNNREGPESIIIPYRFSMRHSGSRDQVATAIHESVETLMHLYAFEDGMWWYHMEFEKNGPYHHDVMLFINGSTSNMQMECAAGFERSYADSPDYVCIGDKCGMYPPCTPTDKPAPCTNGTFRLLAGPACRPLPPPGSLCDRLLGYITGRESAAALGLPAQRVLPRIVDLRCVDGAGADTFVLVDALDGNSSEHEALAGLLGLQDTAAVPVRCCVAALDAAPAAGVCQTCPDMHSGQRRLLADAGAEPGDLSMQWYVVHVVQARATRDGGSSRTSITLSALVGIGAAVVFSAVCVYFYLYARIKPRLQQGDAEHQNQPLLVYRLTP